MAAQRHGFQRINISKYNNHYTLHNMIKTALVTGATSGIGREIALMLARLGYNVAITGRRLPLLQDLCNEIEKTSGVESYILNFDITDKNDVFDSYDMLPDSWKNNLFVLVNNAGVSLGDENFELCDDKDWDRMIDTNIKGTLYVSQLVAQTMKKNGFGHIINISSVNARNIKEGLGVYSATKAAVDAISQSMRIDLLKYGIKVSTVAPGMVNTDLSLVRHRGDIERAQLDFRGIRPLSAADVASAVEFLITRPDHVCIDEITIMPKQCASPHYILRDEEKEN